MSSHTLFDLSRARKTATIASSTETGVYIDWGPDLPARYPGGRARVLVANPTTLFVSWETERPSPDRWIVEIALAHGGGHALEIPGKSPDVWVHAPAGARGHVHLIRVEGGARETVASLPFRTPPDGPSWRTDERWGRLRGDGVMVADVSPPRGGRIEVEAPLGHAAVGYEAAQPGSSGSLPRRT